MFRHLWGLVLILACSKESNKLESWVWDPAPDSPVFDILRHHPSSFLSQSRLLAKRPYEITGLSCHAGTNGPCTEKKESLPDEHFKRIVELVRASLSGTLKMRRERIDCNTDVNVTITLTERHVMLFESRCESGERFTSYLDGPEAETLIQWVNAIP